MSVLLNGLTTGTDEISTIPQNKITAINLIDYSQDMRRMIPENVQTSSTGK